MDTYQKGIFLLILTAIVSGFSIFINSFAVKGFDSSVFTFSKNVVVSLFLLAVLYGFGQWQELKTLKRKHWIQLFIIGLVGGSLPFLLFFKGLQLSSGSSSAFIHKLLFIFVAMFAALFLKEKLTKPLVAGISLLMAGNFFMIFPDFQLSQGLMLVLGATVLWAAENTYAKKVLQDVSGTMVAFGRMFFGSLIILIYLAVTGKAPIILAMSLQQYAWIALTSILLMLYVLSFYNGLKHIKVSTAACILALGSPITTLLAFAFQGTMVSLMQAAGMLFIGAGAALIIWLGREVRLPVNVYERH